ncbi:hypothetical protein JL720_13807 [Aureococcus anophagefferens]|nr:hypothetical protein JL720_13807 [Aureococcus anophagefferens]
MNFSLAFDRLAASGAAVPTRETIFRYDDTNPEAESKEFVDFASPACVDGLETSVAHRVLRRLLRDGPELIKGGKAYVCHQSSSEIEACRKVAGRGRRCEAARPAAPRRRRRRRGALDADAHESPYRSRSAAENLALFERMRASPPRRVRCGSRCRRRRSVNYNMFDQVAYRIKHHPTCAGDACASAINAFCRDVGVTRNENFIEYGRLQHFAPRPPGPRRYGGVADPLELLLEGDDAAFAKTYDAPNHPSSPSSAFGRSRRAKSLSRPPVSEVDAPDFFGLAPGKSTTTPGRPSSRRTRSSSTSGSSASSSRPADGAPFQFERLGFYAVDDDAKAGAVFNRTVSLRQRGVRFESLEMKSWHAVATTQSATVNPKIVSGDVQSVPK